MLNKKESYSFLARNNHNFFKKRAQTFFCLGFFVYIRYVMKEDKKDTDILNGLNLRHVAQIVRRKMITKSVPSKKNYTRKKKHKNRDDE